MLLINNSIIMLSFNPWFNSTLMYINNISSKILPIHSISGIVYRSLVYNITLVFFSFWIWIVFNKVFERSYIKFLSRKYSLVNLKNFPLNLTISWMSTSLKVSVRFPFGSLLTSFFLTFSLTGLCWIFTAFGLKNFTLRIALTFVKLWLFYALTKLSIITFANAHRFQF